MPGRDSQQRQSRPIRRAPVLLPVPQRVHADSHGPSARLLSESHEAPERNDVASLDRSIHDAFALATLEGARKVVCGQFSGLAHGCSPMYSRYSSISLAVAFLALMIRTVSASRCVHTTTIT